MEGQSMFEYESLIGKFQVTVGDDGLVHIYASFDTDEAKGVIEITESNYGISIDIQGVPGTVAGIDLYGQAQPNGYPLLVIDNGDEGVPLGHVVYTPGKPGGYIHLEDGVELIQPGKEIDGTSKKAMFGRVYECYNCSRTMSEEERHDGQGLCPICIDTIQ
jgi:hypothetical protein